MLQIEEKAKWIPFIKFIDQRVGLKYTPISAPLGLNFGIDFLGEPGTVERGPVRASSTCSRCKDATCASSISGMGKGACTGAGALGSGGGGSADSGRSPAALRFLGGGGIHYT